MKRALSIILSCATLMACAAQIYAADGAAVQVESASCAAGETVDIPVRLNGCTGFANLAIEIGYDASAMELTAVAGNNAVGATFVKAQTLDTNPYNMSWNSTDNVSFDGTLVTLTFQVYDSTASGNYEVSVDYYKGRNGDYTDGRSCNYDEDFSPLNLSYQSGVITVSGVSETVRPATETPTMTADPTASPAVGVTETPKATDAPGGGGTTTTTVPTATPAAVPDGIYVAVGSAAGEKGDIVRVPITLNNNNTNGFAGISIEIGYDSSALTLVNVDMTADTGTNVTPAENLAINPYNMSFISAENVYFNGTLAVLEFQIADHAPDGTYAVTVDYYKGREGNYIDGVNCNYYISDEENLIFDTLNLGYLAGEVTVSTPVLKAENINTDNGVSFDVGIHYGGEINGILIAAGYDENGVLTAVTTVPASDVNEISLNGADIRRARVMWWKGTDSMEPFTEALDISLEEFAKEFEYRFDYESEHSSFMAEEVYQTAVSLAASEELAALDTPIPLTDENGNQVMAVTSRSNSGYAGLDLTSYIEGQDVVSLVFDSYIPLGTRTVIGFWSEDSFGGSYDLAEFYQGSTAENDYTISGNLYDYEDCDKWLRTYISIDYTSGYSSYMVISLNPLKVITAGEVGIDCLSDARYIGFISQYPGTVYFDNLTIKTFKRDLLP